jgi:nucleotide-binding universal stress UspA family protein
VNGFGTSPNFGNVQAAGVKVRVDEQHGVPARVIVLHANARKMDVVVLGSNRRRGWRRLREGSVCVQEPSAIK